MNDVMSIILKIVVGVAVLIITRYLIPYIQEKVKGSKYEKMIEIIKEAVEYAEQVYKESGSGPKKKEKVVAFVSEWLRSNGIDVSDAELNLLIEAAVYRLKNGGTNINIETNVETSGDAEVITE